jgi:hypothetical protein
LIIPDKKTDWKEHAPYDGTVDGKPISLLWRAEAQHFATISNLQLSGEIRPDQVVRLDDPDNLTRQVAFVVQGAMPALGATGAYAPYLPLLASPDQFLALVPAADALEIADKIRQEYQKQFGKVQNRLPLFLGIVFFPRKMPLMAVMDTARRLLAAPLEEESWTVAQDVTNGQITFANGVQWNVPTVMGDSTTPDTWYPYFHVKQFADSTPDNYRYRFHHNGRWLVHANDLKQNDVVQVTPSRFAYLFLESTAQRFRFDPQKDVLLLDELPHLTKTWKDICKSPDMTDTKLQAIHALFESRLREWKLGEPTSEHPITDETFRKLVETTLKRDNVQGITAGDVLNGRFRHCINLYLHILKRRVSDEKKKKQEEEHEKQTV